MNIKRTVFASLSKFSSWAMVLQFAAFAMILCGLKFWLIQKYGNNTPFWDQWDGEALNLYHPYMTHTLTISDLFAPHNEHRIFTTRLLCLALLNINSTWYPFLQMVVNAGLHIITICVCIVLFSKITGKQFLPILLFFALIIFGLPFGWENTLAGFQSQFYFVMLFSIISLWIMMTKEPLSSGWWTGVVFSVLAFLSLASGSFSFGSAMFTALVVFFSNIRRTPKQLTAVGILAVFFLICIKVTPAVPGHEVLRVSSVGQFYSALSGVLGWPIASNGIAALIRNLPALAFIILILKSPPKANDPKWFLFALIVWSVGQAFSLAYGRGLLFASSRYTDLYCLTILINLACLLLVIHKIIKRPGNLPSFITALWCVVIFISAFKYAYKKLPDELNAKKESSLIQEINTRNYIMSADTSFLRNKPILQIPYPDGVKLGNILSMPDLRQILPSNLNPGLSPVEISQGASNGFVRNGFYPATPPPPNQVLGSYTGIGDNALGDLVLKFDAPTSGRINIPVAGYPLRDSIKFEIEQAGKIIPSNLSDNPKESWAYAEIKIDKGPFFVRLSDHSTSTWLAVGYPLQTGRFDNAINHLVSHYYVFLFIGLIAIFFLINYSAFWFTGTVKTHQ